MSGGRDFLVEIGTEELPPKALRGLMDAFASGFEAALDEARLAHGDVHAYASPRRLALVVDALADSQPDRELTQKGPPVSVAFDDDGNPKPPAIAFAKKCGVDVADLGRSKTDKGEWLSFDLVERGQPADELLPGLVEKALAQLPIPKLMRWGDSDHEFVRPVHWIILLHGDAVIDKPVLGITAGNTTRGHRFHSKGDVTIKSPADYLVQLEEHHVIADFEKRRALVEDGVEKAAADAGGAIVDGDNLYDEVAALVEWPVPLLGRFEDKFLELPREVVVSTLSGHQRYFPVADEAGALMPLFVTVANLDSPEPDKVRDGNERVIRPRLADAAFFWDTDRRHGLAQHIDRLDAVVYQRGLGSLRDKSVRTGALATTIAAALGHDTKTVARAASLMKCDLLTGMVGEFPELQGTMGRYYAIADGESDAVANAIGEHYQPRFAGDALPASIDGRILAVADKLDTLAGIFALGKKPSGNRDPFGLRRAALGVVRILVEAELDLDLPVMIGAAIDAQPEAKGDRGELAHELYTFITERLRRYFLDRDTSLATETFDAVMAREPASLVDFDQRLHAVQDFLGLDEAESLAAANKRIANILRQADAAADGSVAENLLEDGAERALFKALSNVSKTVAPKLGERQYTDALRELAGLKEPVDSFFDDVMVMVDDESVRNNRLAMLSQLRALFLDVADISRLSIA